MEISLSACRVNARMSQADMAKALSVSPATIFNWEKGKSEPSLTQLRKISELSGIPIDNIAVGQDSIILDSNS